MRTWDGRHSIAAIDVHLVYFVPHDRTPLPDWRARLDHFAQRIADFHHAEFGREQSRLNVLVRPSPLVSRWTSAELRSGSADFTFFRTLEEADADVLHAATEKPAAAFPIVLVLSDINYRPLDDMFRVKPQEASEQHVEQQHQHQQPSWKFEGSMDKGVIHVPGAPSGGSRAIYLSDAGKGWGIVSADGWRVPYRGSDCVVYHEGVGHAIGLPHPDIEEHSVMSHGQYAGWINQSWVTPVQKETLGWAHPSQDPVAQSSSEFVLFRSFLVTTDPVVPAPNENIILRLSWDKACGCILECRVEYQTRLFDPWKEVSVDMKQDLREDGGSVVLGPFSHETPLSYRVRVKSEQGQEAEIYGYLQVRADAKINLVPGSLEDVDLADRFVYVPPVQRLRVPRPSGQHSPLRAGLEEIDLLALVDPTANSVSGSWQILGDDVSAPRVLESPKAPGARIELPYELPEEYRMTLIVQPLDEPNAFLVGQCVGGNRCLVLISYAVDGLVLNAVENVDGHNVDFLDNPTRAVRSAFKRFRPAEIVYTVTKNSIHAQVDGQDWTYWEGDPASLSLSAYWTTPTQTRSFIGAYDCRYRIHRVTLEPLAPLLPSPRAECEAQAQSPAPVASSEGNVSARGSRRGSHGSRQQSRASLSPPKPAFNRSPSFMRQGSRKGSAKTESHV